MHTYGAEIFWQDAENAFATGRYSRAHLWTFDGMTVAASASPNVVRLPYSREDAVDPEEAFVASVASCHMLTFLFIAHKEGFVIKRYRDKAVGTMTKDEDGKEWISKVLLDPEIEFVGEPPTMARLTELHEEAHRECYIANSIKSAVEIKAG